MKGYKTLSQIMTFANGETFLFISYNDCIFTQAECVLHSNVTPFNLHLSSIIFDTHILSWSLYNIAPGFLFLSFSLSLSLSLLEDYNGFFYWRMINLERCQTCFFSFSDVHNILNDTGNNLTKCQIVFVTNKAQIDNWLGYILWVGSLVTYTILRYEIYWLKSITPISIYICLLQLYIEIFDNPIHNIS